MLEQIQRNYDQIKADAQAIINDEMERIMNDPELCERLGIEKQNLKTKRMANKSWPDLIFKKHSVSLNLK